MTKKTELTQTADMFPTDVPEFLQTQGTGRGNEDVSVDDLTIPRVSIIQDLSPYHKKSKPEYIDGAETGMAFNTVSKQLYGKELFIVPVYFRKEWVLWKDQSKGGGFFGAFSTQAEADQERASIEGENPDDIEAVDTAQHFVLILGSDGNVLEEAVISMSKSQMKPSRALNTQVRMAGGDRFSRVYALNVIEAQNKAGQDYFNWDIKPLGYVNKPTFLQAEAMYDSVKSGDLDVSRKTDSESAQSDPIESVDDEM